MLSEEDRKTILDCASDLEASINAEYRGTLDYSSQKIKYEQDMKPVVEVRAIVDRLPASPPAPQILRIRSLLTAIIDNNPNDDAADAVTVLDVWRKESQEILAALRSAQAPATPVEIERLLKNAGLTSRDGTFVSAPTREIAAALRSLQAPPRTYADGIEDAAKVAENFALAIIPDQCSARDTVKFQREKITAAIRALATEPSAQGEKV